MIYTARTSLHFYVIKVILYVLALIAVITGALALTMGTRVVPDAGAVTASLDNEFRFFSVFWLFYGISCFNTARHLGSRLDRISQLAAIMLIAAIARTLSIILVGMPGRQYFYGAIVEYIFAALLFVAHRKLKTSGPDRTTADQH